MKPLSRNVACLIALLCASLCLSAMAGCSNFAAGTAAAKGGLLPPGFEPLEKAGKASDGYPLRIRCVKDGSEMVYVPPGRFCYQFTESNTWVSVGRFYIDKYETTNEQYVRFCKVTKRKLPKYQRVLKSGIRPLRGFDGPRLPVTCVLWEDADAYCKWAGKELPSKNEWLRAALGEGKHPFPWGKAAPKGNAAEKERFAIYGRPRRPLSAAKPAAVGGRRAGASPCGAEDLVGNVAEFLSGRIESDSYYRVAGGAYWNEWPGRIDDWVASSIAGNRTSALTEASPWYGFRGALILRNRFATPRSTLTGAKVATESPAKDPKGTTFAQVAKDAPVKYQEGTTYIFNPAYKSGEKLLVIRETNFKTESRGKETDILCRTELRVDVTKGAGPGLNLACNVHRFRLLGKNFRGHPEVDADTATGRMSGDVGMGMKMFKTVAFDASLVHGRKLVVLRGKGQMYDTAIRESPDDQKEMILSMLTGPYVNMLSSQWAYIPSKPVKVGDSWSVNCKTFPWPILTDAAPDGSAEVTCKLSRVEATKSGPVAEIAINGTVKLGRANAKSPIAGKCTGVVKFNLATGKLEKLVLNTNAKKASGQALTFKNTLMLTDAPK